MPAIKTVGGKVVTKSGKPSCTCCCPVCDSIEIWFEWATQYGEGDPNDSHSDPEWGYIYATYYGSFMITPVYEWDAEAGVCVMVGVAGTFDLTVLDTDLVTEIPVTVEISYSTGGTWEITTASTQIDGEFGHLQTPPENPCNPDGLAWGANFYFTIGSGDLTLSMTELP